MHKKTNHLITKEEQLLELAKMRQQNVPHGFKGIVEYHKGVYECDYVSPYTKTAKNVDAEIMLILQDWSCDENLSKPVDLDVVNLGRTPGLPTNKNLEVLLETHFGILLSDTYSTNLFPFIKPGKISAPIPFKYLREAAINFAIPQVQVVSPKVVVCLGLKVFNAICKELGRPIAKNLSTAISAHFHFGNTIIWAQSHPGGLGRANRNRGGVDRVSADWAEMASAIKG